MRRQTEGSETWKRLKDWDRDQKASERLSAQIIRVEGYTSIDPSHPLGGPDGLKDIVCFYEQKKWIASCYFPRIQKTLNEIMVKFKNDIDGMAKNQADGFVFLTNQELTLSERDSLINESHSANVNIYHLERISSILDSPRCYGIRLEYLDIEMTKEEQIAYISLRDQMFENLEAKLGELLDELKNKKSNSKVGAHYVIPEINSYSIWSSNSIHRCTYCKYGFKIFPIGTALPLPGNRTVTCPKCGNVDEYEKLF